MKSCLIRTIISPFLWINLILSMCIITVALAVQNDLTHIESATGTYESDQPDIVKEPLPAEIFYSESSWPIYIIVPSTAEGGVSYVHEAPPGNYRLEIWSPEGLSDLEYSPLYVWQNNIHLPPEFHRWHGGAVFVLKNKFVIWVNDRVSNWDYELATACCFFDPPYNENRKRAADAARGIYVDICLEPGDFLILVVNGIRGIFWQNSGNITLKLHPIINYIKVFPDPTYVHVEKGQQFIAKGYGFGPNGVMDGEPDPETHEPQGDDTGPVDIEVTWTTSVDERVGTIDEGTGFFQAGREVGGGIVTASYICPDGSFELTDEVDITVFKIEFLIRDRANFWNLIKHIPAENRYRDHKDSVFLPERQHVIVAADTTGSAKVNLEIITDPVGVEDKIAWRASSQNVTPQSGSFNTDGKSEATISSSGVGEETYEFDVGFDSNRNGILDTGEETISVNKVLLLTKSLVELSFNGALDAARLADISRLFDISSTNLLIFLGKPDEANIPSEIKPSTVKRDEDDKIAILLEHPVGADFSPTTGIANIDLRKFDPDSKTADRIETSVALGKAIEDELRRRKTDILNFFAQPNSPPYHVFPFTQPGVFVEFMPEDDIDLNLGIGKAKLSYELKVHVRKVGQVFIIEKLFVDGTVEDLYDWDFYLRPEDRIMATIQFAWRSPPSDNAGRIFRTEVKFKTRFENFPFPE